VIDYLQLIKQEKLCIFDVPKEHVTYEICLESVKLNGMLLYYVPSMLKTLELCKIAVSQFGCVIYDVPSHLQTNEICKIALQYGLGNFKYIKSPSQEIIDLYNLLSI
jgi:hypothetical protein